MVNLFLNTSKNEKKWVPIPPKLLVKNIQNNTVYTVQELIFSFSERVIIAGFTSSVVSVRLSTNLSINLFLHLQFL